MITPSSAVLDGKEVQQFTAGLAVSWNSTVGNLFLDAACTTPYNPLDDETDVYLKAQNFTSQGTVTAGVDIAPVTITGLFPITPNWGFQVTPDKRGVQLNVKRDGSVNGRILGSGDLVRKYKLGFSNRLLAIWEEFEEFYDNHYPFETFKYVDEWRNINGIFRFDSVPTATPASYNRVGWEVTLDQIG
jgi:hypothetical protein